MFIVVFVSGNVTIIMLKSIWKSEQKLESSLPNLLIVIGLIAS